MIYEYYMTDENCMEESPPISFLGEAIDHNEHIKQ
jgi:hypothetical protein